MKFRHVLVDEFQDTNRVQYDLVRQLAEATRNLTVVGDDDQSIYAWRGAEPRNLLDFDRDFADARVIKLEQNYRSTQTILDAANAVIARNVDRHKKSLWTDHGAGESIELYQAGDERGEAVLRGAARSGGCSTRGRTRRTTSRSCTGRTRSRACSRSTCGRRGCRRRWSARSRSSSARRSRTSSRTSGCSGTRRRTRRSSAWSTSRRARIGETTVDRLRAAARANGTGIYEAARLRRAARWRAWAWRRGRSWPASSS